MSVQEVKALREIGAVLKEHGLEGYSAKLAEIEAGYGTPFSMPGRSAPHTPSMMRSPEYARTPSETGSPEPMSVGEKVTELDPSGMGAHKEFFYGFEEPKTVEELIKAQKSGQIAVMHLQRDYDQTQDPYLKAIYKKGLDDAQRFFKIMLNKEKVMKTAMKLSSISKVLTEKGFDTLGRRLLEAAESLSPIK